MLERLKIIETRYNQIGEDLQKPEVVKDIKKMTSLMKEMSSLEKIVVVYHEYIEVMKQISDLKELTKDEDNEIREMATLDLEETLAREESLIEDLKILLIPKDPNDEKNVIVEIRGAAGGDEANIFAGDLFRMYTRFAESKGWKIEVLSAYAAELGGFSQIEFMMSGDNVYSFMKYESGAHRVQRVPETESQGRIQTSTATVLVMPEADEFDVQMDMNDVRVDIFCSSGPGGQSVNTTKSAVRVTHVPTGIVVSCQDGKSQHENKTNALKVLQARLYDKLNEERLEKEGKERLSKIGHGDRSEKIRTYNYPQNRVTDHRIGFTIQQLDRVMEGKLDTVINALITEDQKRILSDQK
ncbi:MAG TPA: peptide chain release factor 1 [Bacilli bacterium]|jgi:peptide chain release factor 1|nr:peptide chain release factor 1 [Acholeplasmataceae bacterium]HNZ77842.1 peptide chain release factor 1 [Bacilli bacterium]HOD60889.1 peptide chain release factor 1 [Bacilli bacterium]HOH61051.1 peptide chain release factor 1 [Bacilli bacterium]HPB48735.1 peptide chain release factor 1 [Bacilli bacterium]